MDIIARMRMIHRMFKKVFHQGRSERRGEAYFISYVKSLSDARTKLEDFFNILLDFMRTPLVGNSDIDRRMFCVDCGAQREGLFLFTMHEEDGAGPWGDGSHVG